MKPTTDYERNVFIELTALGDESSTFKDDYKNSTGIDREIKEGIMNGIAENLLTDEARILLAAFRIAGITEQQAAQVFYITSIKVSK